MISLKTILNGFLRNFKHEKCSKKIEKFREERKGNNGTKHLSKEEKKLNE